MYPNLRAEMAKRQITNTKLADVLGVHENTIGNKINGKGRFTIEEAFVIKARFFMGAAISMEYLFERTDINKAS